MIRVLEDVVVDQIAAGEVVERPASVLKELVENALDAGATRLEIRLKDGGASLVRVTDDGSGMSPDDALLCIERHATSKLRSADDLVGIATFGFRGEALPSIASVSRFELRTQRAQDEVGTTVRMEGGRMEHVGPSAGTVGTDISVRALFHNVPARRRFLRTAHTELAHCMEAIHRQVVLRPDVDVTVWHDGRQVLRAPATDDPARRVRDIIGADVDPLVPVWLSAAGLEVTGLVAAPSIHRAAASGGIYTFVHGRYVRDTVVRRAVRDAYGGLLPRGRFPVVVLDVRGPAGFVDVNVHPAKVEVRFQSPRDVLQVVTDAVQAALKQPGARPVRERERSRGVVPAAPEEQLDLLGPPSGSRPSAPASAPVAVQPAASLPAARPQVPPTTPATPIAALPPAPPPAPVRAVRLSVVGPVAPLATPRVDLQLVVGTHAVGTRQGSVVLVDLARLQLDVTAWRLIRGRDAGGVASQPLLAPVRVSLGRAEAERVVAAAEALSALGLEVAAFGPGELAVTGLPVELPAHDPASLLLAAAAALIDGRDALPGALASVAAPPDTLYGARTLLAAWEEVPDAHRAAGGLASFDAAALDQLLRSAGG